MSQPFRTWPSTSLKWASRTAIAGVIPFTCLPLSLCQTTATSSSEVQAAELQARSALLSTAQPSTIAFDGTFSSTEGSLAQDGNVHLTIGSDGSYVANIFRNPGVTGEARTVSEGNPACTWTDQNNVIHNGAFLNCILPAWFFPGLTLLSPNTDTSVPAWTATSYTSDSLGNHLLFQFIVPVSGPAQGGPPSLSSLDLILAPDTHLPQCALFVIHPDTAGFYADIPVKIAYSDYRNISGVKIPFRIQRFVNGSLVLDLTMTSVAVQ